MNARAIILFLVLLVTPAGAQTLQNLADNQRDCAACHLEWTPDFNQAGAVLLLDKPAISTAAREETCLGCHDGSVRDSRKKVWQEQSHRTGMVPPPTMQIPAKLPLEDGKIACRTCHSAHNVPGSPDLSNIFFLRVQNDQSQLCRTCHTDKQSAPTHLNHPMGHQNFTVPAILTSAGAKTGPAGQELICQSCHEAHGSKADKLLVLPAGDNTLCLACHEKLNPQRWGNQAAGHNHPVNASLSSEAQRNAITAMGTRAGPNQTLACLSCHRLHDAQPKTKLLADTLAGSKLCIRCHADHATVTATVHDMRTSAPTTRNSAKETAEDSGPCSACHLPHQPARESIAAAGDPTGQCTSCHSNGGIATRTAVHFNHPDRVNSAKLPRDLALTVIADKSHPGQTALVCSTCHNPHLAGVKKFLRKTPDQLCAGCHEQSVTLAGAHDFTTPSAANNGAKNGLGETADQSGRCGFCHDVHKGSGSILWAATATAPATAAELCTQCHNASGLASKHPVPGFSHPTGVATATDATMALPLFDLHGQRVDQHGTVKYGTVQCASCHNPHADSTKSRRLLRVTGNTSQLCMSCHTDKSSLTGTRHDAHLNPAWKNSKIGDDSCMGCHLAHTNDASRKNKLWAGPIDGAARTPIEQRCLGCHDNQTAPRPQIPVHPTVVFSLLNSAATTQPAGTAPRPLPTDQSFACDICHQPHGSNSTEIKAISVAAATQPAEVALQLRAAARPMLKSDVARDICATCHGDDAGRVFLYYHRPRQRQSVQMLQQPDASAQQQ